MVGSLKSESVKHHMRASKFNTIVRDGRRGSNESRNLCWVFGIGILESGWYYLSNLRNWMKYHIKTSNGQRLKCPEKASCFGNVWVEFYIGLKIELVLQQIECSQRIAVRSMVIGQVAPARKRKREKRKRHVQMSHRIGLIFILVI